MKNTLKLFLIMILAFSSLRANAVIYTASQAKVDIARRVEENYKKYTDAQISVTVTGVPFRDLDLPNGKISFDIKSTAERFMPRDLEKVTIYVNNRPVKTFNAPVVIKAYEDVLVASSFIDIGRKITPDVVVIKKVEVSNTFGYQLKPEALNREMMTRKAFREGEFIDRRFVKAKPDIFRSANVTVVFSTNDFAITTEATALSDGVIGDTICLINKNFNKTYKGTIIGENRVLVKL